MSSDHRPKHSTGPSRRTILKLVGAAGATLALPLPIGGCGDNAGKGTDADAGPPIGDASPGLDGGTAGDALPIPPMLDGDLAGGMRTFELNLQAGSMEWVTGTPTATYGVNGAFLGPTMHFRRGERVRIEVTNALTETTTLHWHGMEVPAQADGGPYQPVAPGATWVSEYDVIQRAMMAWYHPHQMHQTARQVYMGMAGLIYLDDPAQSIDLPSTYGVDDVPLVVQDRRFASDGTHPYSAGNTIAMHDRMSGLRGDTILVNGAASPVHQVPQGLVRLRILNGSNARNYNFGFDGDRHFAHIGGDGGLFDAPIRSTRVLLGPAERADILVNFSGDTEGAELALKSYSGEVFASLFTGGMGANLADDLDRGTFDVMTFRVGTPPASVIAPPTSFDPIVRMKDSDAVRTRNIVLSMVAGAVYINDARMLDMNSVPAAINFNIPAGDIELWNVTNTSGMAHPLHLHNRHFQVLDIGGQPPPAHLAGWKDTVLVAPDQAIRILVEFAGTADTAFPYMFHCHILEHEDAGMMGQFYIVAPT